MKKFIIAVVTLFAAINAVAAPDSKIWNEFASWEDHVLYFPTAASFDKLSVATEEGFVMQVLVTANGKPASVVMAVEADSCKEDAMAGRIIMAGGALQNYDLKTSKSSFWVKGSGSQDEALGNKLCNLYRARLYHAKSVNM